MAQWTRDMFGLPEDERAGEAGTYFSQFAAALQTWVAMQQRSPSVDEAALCFNVAPDLVREACDGRRWIVVVNDRLELEGE
jgi:hypothetical protein